MPYESLKQTLRFLVIEIESQIKLTAKLLESRDEQLLEKIAAKDDYVDNLKAILEKECFCRINEDETVPADTLNELRAVHIMAVNLERIGDFCVNIGKQAGYMSSMDMVHRLRYGDMIAPILETLCMVTPAFLSKDLSAALRICRIEYHLDQMFKERFHEAMGALREAGRPEDLVTAIFIVRYLERIGDALLNIGEALLLVINGEKLKLEQYETLQEALSRSHWHAGVPDLELSAILGSRSGCRISRIKPKHGNEQPGIFKEGNRKKIQQEHENLRRWETIQPGLVPKIFSYLENNGSAAMIVEYISGITLEEILLNAKAEILHVCLLALKETIGQIWRKTLQKGTYATDYMEQLQSRLEGVRQVHPDYYRKEAEAETEGAWSTPSLLKACIAIEKEIPAPTQVFIHGDFNTNNIFYEVDGKAIRYIDLYRSRFADYIQDASVFLVSNYRLPVFDLILRARLNSVMDDFLRFFRDFALEIEDKAFDARMTLALARSFYTSTRFELNAEFSRNMFHKAHFLMESVVSHQGSWASFKIPLKILEY